MEIAVDAARRVAVVEPVVAFGIDLDLEELGSHRSVERGDALLRRCQLVGRAEDPDKRVLEHELQPRRLAEGNVRRLDPLDSFVASGALAQHGHRGVVGRERCGFVSIRQLAGQRVPLLSCGRAWPGVRDHERDRRASPGGLEADPARRTPPECDSSSTRKDASQQL